MPSCNNIPSSLSYIGIELWKKTPRARFERSALLQHFAPNCRWRTRSRNTRKGIWTPPYVFAQCEHHGCVQKRASIGAFSSAHHMSGVYGAHESGAMVEARPFATEIQIMRGNEKIKANPWDLVKSFRVVNASFNFLFFLFFDDPNCLFEES